MPKGTLYLHNGASKDAPTHAKGAPAPAGPYLSNAEIADRLTSIAHLLAAQKANPFKVKAYRRAADTVKTLPESVGELVRSDEDLTQYSGIGRSISNSIRELVLTGRLRQLEALRSAVGPEIAAITEYPRLDPKLVVRVYKKLGIGSVAGLREKLESGEIREKLGTRIDQHVRQALAETHEMLLYDADEVATGVSEFLLKRCGVGRVQATGDYRRRAEVVGEIAFLIESDNFPAVVSKLQSYGGRADLLNSAESTAVFKLAPGILLRIDMASRNKWGVALILSTGSENHLKKLQAATFDLKELLSSKDSYPDESAVYRKLGMSFIEPELREGHDEVELARRGALPILVSAEDIRGELHAHTVSSDGANTIEQMAAAARAKNYEYTGISDHSQSLKIAGGLSEDDLWQQIRYIDKLNEKTGSIRILKSAEVDILVDGTLDYSNELLRELDYTVCSIHSRFGLSKADQTNRILCAMDNPHFTILGHATGRLLLKRPGYEIEIERVVEHAKATGCFFEINSSPDRLDLSAANARLARQAGVKIAVSTDAHSTRELDYINLGVDQARRAGLERSSILNCLSWPALRGVLKR